MQQYKWYIGNETKVVTTLPSFLRCCCSKIHPPTTCTTQRKLRTRPQSIRKPLNSNPCYCEHVKQCHPFCGHVIPSALPRAAASSLVVWPSSSSQESRQASLKWQQLERLPANFSARILQCLSSSWYTSPVGLWSERHCKCKGRMYIGTYILWYIVSKWSLKKGWVGTRAAFSTLLGRMLGSCIFQSRSLVINNINVKRWMKIRTMKPAVVVAWE